MLVMGGALSSLACVVPGFSLIHGGLFTHEGARDEHWDVSQTPGGVWEAPLPPEQSGEAVGAWYSDQVCFLVCFLG